MKNCSCSLLLCVLLSGFAAGCASKTAYVDPKGSRLITTVDEINIQDFTQAAEDAIQSLLVSGALDKVPNPPAVLVISRIVNNTSQHVDTDLLIKKIRVALNQSGKALTRTTFAVGGEAEDPVAQGLQQERESLENKKVTQAPADFSLSGKIIEDRTRAGNTRQSAFVFQLSLTDSRGLAVWEGEKQIVKQGKRPSVGF
jgi:hypothetical protein